MKKNLLGYIVVIISVIISMVFTHLSKNIALLESYAIPYISGYFAFITILSYSILKSIVNIKINKYINAFILVVGMKFLLNLIALLIFVLIEKEQVKGTIICFATNYIIFLVIDTVALLKVKQENVETR